MQGAAICLHISSDIMSAVIKRLFDLSLITGELNQKGRVGLPAEDICSRMRAFASGSH